MSYPDETRPRYYVRTVRPHVWALMRRDDANITVNPQLRPNSDLDEVVEWFGARQYNGDVGAKRIARIECDRANRLDRRGGSE